MEEKIKVRIEMDRQALEIYKELYKLEELPKEKYVETLKALLGNLNEYGKVLKN